MFFYNNLANLTHIHLVNVNGSFSNTEKKTFETEYNAAYPLRFLYDVAVFSIVLPVSWYPLPILLSGFFVVHLKFFEYANC